ncbi:uncharacterized protein [Montipora capricornis]|uniref:uncharacterized protein n=1 Tax=Montipora capricornis TaxID=246305 RepID=UPI0035F17B91
MKRKFLNLVGFISIFARESCGVDESKAFFNTVRRGHMIIKCEEKYGQQPAAKNGEGEPCRQGCEFFYIAVNSGISFKEAGCKPEKRADSRTKDEHSKDKLKRL